ncbi:uncharacterized protein LOC111018083 isoform X2 [Momordica charantia]|uniref:Uncharacterized protein LOC111018083 isoform X2 n=1 Tax=Momordica charantia TaxID=3673 RepID=A0A6J1D9A7_MOMCH|nr:uncharacterized protein LOC111018083 isoform X2 [Momordica charantia]
MALTSSSSSSSSSSFNVCLLKSGLSIKPMSRVWMLRPTKFFPLKKSLPLQIRSSIKNKVFEDQSEGVICYADENGEIICEGYDEGPRFHQNPSEKANHQRKRWWRAKPCRKRCTTKKRLQR